MIKQILSSAFFFDYRDEVKKTFKFTFLNLTYIAPSPQFTLDFSDLYLGDEFYDEKIRANFIFNLNVINVLNDYGTPDQKLRFSKAGKAWTYLSWMKESIKEIKEWMDYAVQYFVNEKSINDYINYRDQEKTIYTRRYYHPSLRIAAIVQDPNLPKIYQFWLDRISPEYEEARKDLINFYENDIAEISRIVAAKKQKN